MSGRHNSLVLDSRARVCPAHWTGGAFICVRISIDTNTASTFLGDLPSLHGHSIDPADQRGLGAIRAWRIGGPSKLFEEVALEDTALGKRDFSGSMEVEKEGVQLIYFLNTFCTGKNRDF